MKLFAKQTVDDLKASQDLWLFSEWNFSPSQGEQYFRSNPKWCSNNFSSKSLKNTCEWVDFSLIFRLGIYSFTKGEVIHRCFSRVLVAPSAGSFTGCHFQVPSFVKKLLWHKIYFGMDYPPPTPHPPPPIMPYSPINIEIFSTPLPLFSILKTPYPAFAKGVVQTMYYLAFWQDRIRAQNILLVQVKIMYLNFASLWTTFYFYLFFFFFIDSHKDLLQIKLFRIHLKTAVSNEKFRQMIWMIFILISQINEMS